MLITEITPDEFETIFLLEQKMFGAEALNRYALFQQLRIFRETSLCAKQGGTIVGYAFGLVKSTGESWITVLASLPVALTHQRISRVLAATLADRLLALNARVAYATTRRHEIIDLAALFHGQVVEEVPNYFGDGKPRYVLEFKPQTEYQASP